LASASSPISRSTATEDSDLKVRDGSHLFPVHTTWAGFRRGMLLRGSCTTSCRCSRRTWQPRVVQAAENSESQEEVERDFAAIKIPFLR
jgi:hypothetical protein